MASRRTIAVIDAGSNSVRLLVARELSETAFEVVDEERFDARLGESGDSGALTAEAQARGIEALRFVAQVAHAHSPTTVVATGTEALRRAPNASAFLDRVRVETGLDLYVLSAREEAFASYLGVINSTLLRDGSVLDVGGGSAELIRVRDREFASSVSAPLGALYARARYLQHDPPTRREERALRKAVRGSLDVSPADEIVGVGGAVRNLARMVRQRRGYPLRRLHGLVIERRELTQLTRVLLRVPADERRRIPGVGSGRADTLHAAAVVMDEVMETAGAIRLVVSGQGLREGLVWQELRGASLVPDVRAASVAGLAQANGVDALTAEPVVTVAGELFAATRSLHRGGEAELDLLLTAARLAGVGMHIDYYSRDRHAEYLVHSGDLHGFTHREIVLLGALVRAADGGQVDLSPYRPLVSGDDGRRLNLLAALLGAARAIRRRTPSPVLRVEAHTGKRGLELHLVGTAALDAERAALERQAPRLAAVLGAPVTVRVTATSTRG